MSVAKKLTGRALDGLGRLRSGSTAVETGAASLPQMAGRLRAVFGPRLTAVIVGVNSAELIGAWAHGRQEPNDVAAERIREAYRVVELLGQQESPEAIRLWFTGRNPWLDDRAPAVVLAEDPAAVLSAARAYLARG